MKTQIEIKVRGYHLDGYGHVNNARYLEFLEEARWDFLDKQPEFSNIIQQNLNFVVVNININYRNPARMGDKLLVTTYLNKIGNTSGVIHQEVTSLDQSLNYADADITFVLLNGAGKIQPMKGELKELMDTLNSN